MARGKTLRAIVANLLRADSDPVALSNIKIHEQGSWLGEITDTYAFYFRRNHDRQFDALAGAFLGRAEFQFPQCTAISRGDEKPLYKRLGRSGGKETLCAGLRAVSRRQSARHGTGSSTRQHARQERKTRRVVLVHHQREAGIGYALMGEPVAATALANRDVFGVTSQHEDRSEVKSLKETLIKSVGNPSGAKAQLVLSTCGRPKGRPLQRTRPDQSPLSFVTAAMTRNPL